MLTIAVLKELTNEAKAKLLGAKDKQNTSPLIFQAITKAESHIKYTVLLVS